MKTAVVYYSMSGNAELIAEQIAKRMGADTIRIEPEKAFPDKGFRKFFWGGKSAVMGDMPKLLPYSFDESKYERVIIGTPVWAGSFTPPIRTFVSENAQVLKNKRLAVFTCLSGAGAEKAISKLKDFLGIDAFEAELILIDPKVKPSADNDKKVADFCEKLL